MARVLLAFGLLADGAALALLIGLSGFVFGGGPQGANGDPSAVAVWSAGVLLVLAAAIGGILAARRGRADMGALIAWAPPAAGLLFGLAA